MGENIMLVDKNLEYFALTEKNADQIWPLLAKGFFPREPISLGLGAKAEDMKNMVCAGIPEWSTSGVSSGVRDTETGQLVGIMLVNILNKEKPTTFTDMGEDLNDKIRLTRAVLSYVETKFDVFKEEKVDKVGEMAMLTVDPKYSGRGIARKLIQIAEDLLVEKGMTVAYSQATNKISALIFTKCGYETRSTVDFETFEVDGKQILDISKMEGTTQAAIVTKKIFKSKENKL